MNGGRLWVVVFSLKCDAVPLWDFDSLHRSDEAAAKRARELRRKGFVVEVYEGGGGLGLQR